MSKEITDKELMQIHKQLPFFKSIYENGKEVNPIPNGEKVTVYCESNEESGYVVNVLKEEMGLEELIAKKWILHSELENILTQALTPKTGEN